MFQILLEILDYLLIGTFFSAVAISAVLYLGKQKKSAILIAAYFLAQLLLEMQIRAGEATTPLANCFNRLFSATAMIRGLSYSIVLFLLVLLLLTFLGIETSPKFFIAPSLISTWMLCIPMIQKTTMLVYWLFLLPYELFYLFFALYGLRRIKTMPEKDELHVLQCVLYLIVGFSVCIIFEETIASWYYGFFTEFRNTPDPVIGIAYIRERNYCDSIMQLALGIAAIFVNGREILRAMSSSEPMMKSATFGEPPVETENITGEPPAEAKNTASEFAAAIGLSPREREVFLLLLNGLNSQQIAQELYISQGTVKSHTHNIYQKAGVNDRIGLIRKINEDAEPKPTLENDV